MKVESVADHHHLGHLMIRKGNQWVILTTVIKGIGIEAEKEEKILIPTGRSKGNERIITITDAHHLPTAFPLESIKNRRVVISLPNREVGMPLTKGEKEESITVIDHRCLMMERSVAAKNHCSKTVVDLLMIKDSFRGTMKEEYHREKEILITIKAIGRGNILRPIRTENLATLHPEISPLPLALAILILREVIILRGILLPLAGLRQEITIVPQTIIPLLAITRLQPAHRRTSIVEEITKLVMTDQPLGIVGRRRLILIAHLHMMILGLEVVSHHHQEPISDRTAQVRLATQLLSVTLLSHVWILVMQDHPSLIDLRHVPISLLYITVTDLIITATDLLNVMVTNRLNVMTTALNNTATDLYYIMATNLHNIMATDLHIMVTDLHNIMLTDHPNIMVTDHHITATGHLRLKLTDHLRVMVTDIRLLVTVHLFQMNELDLFRQPPNPLLLRRSMKVLL